MSPESLVAHWQGQGQQEQVAEQAMKDETRANFQSIVDEIAASNQKLVKFILNHVPEVSVKNFPRAEFPKTIGTPDVKEVVKAVKGLEQALKPERTDDSGIINAINSLKSQNDQLLNVVRQLELAPNITVPAAKVKVDAPDLSPIEKAIKANKPEAIDLSPLLDKLDAQQKQLDKVVKALASLPEKMPVQAVPNVPTDPLIYYLPSDMDVSGGASGVNYYGYTDNRGAWYVKRIDQSTSTQTIRMCFGQTNYATNWTNRTGLTYVLWGS